METFSPVIIASTNIFALDAIRQLYLHGRYYGVGLVSCAAISSVLMHITETKHGLTELCFPGYSQLFLNIDRFFGVLSALYGVYLFYCNPNKKKIQVVLPIIGGICSVIGELTNNLVFYTCLHSIWHPCAYYGLKYVSF